MTATLERVDQRVNAIFSITEGSVTGIKLSIREDCIRLREVVALRISVVEIRLTRETVTLTHDAEYHLLRAYFHASPSLILILTAIYGFVMTVINIISTINTIVKVITGEVLAYWLEKLIPGFQAAWNNIMNKISEFSSILGWGVDGVHHLINGFDASADLWSMVTGKDRAAAQTEKIRNMQTVMLSYSYALKKWQDNPGEQIAAHAEMWSKMRYNEGAAFINKWVDTIGVVGGKVEKALTDVGTVSSELLSLRNDMPAFIAKNIPQGLWDGIGRVDTTINDRILPALQDITDKLDELDAVLDAYRAKAEALADKIAHPGDMLAEIDKLPGYARTDQLVKIDSVTSTLLREQNEAEYKLMEAGLKESALIAAALSQAPAPLPFMELELPGRSPGIVAEPRETWFVGDY